MSNKGQRMTSFTLPEPKQRKWVPKAPTAPFPVPVECQTGLTSIGNWWYYTAYIVNGAILVKHSGDMDQLYKLGFFGKGTLSRHRPVFKNNQPVVNRCDRESGCQNKLQILSRRRYLRRLLWANGSAQVDEEYMKLPVPKVKLKQEVQSISSSQVSKQTDRVQGDDQAESTCVQRIVGAGESGIDSLNSEVTEEHDPWAMDTKCDDPWAMDTKGDDPWAMDTKGDDPWAMDTKGDDPWAMDTKDDDPWAMDTTGDKPAAMDTKKPTSELTLCNSLENRNKTDQERLISETGASDVVPSAQESCSTTEPCTHTLHITSAKPSTDAPAGDNRAAVTPDRPASESCGGNVTGDKPASESCEGNVTHDKPASESCGGNVITDKPASESCGGNVTGDKPASESWGGNVTGDKPASESCEGNVTHGKPASESCRDNVITDKPASESCDGNVITDNPASESCRDNVTPDNIATESPTECLHQAEEEVYDERCDSEDADADLFVVEDTDDEDADLSQTRRKRWKSVAKRNPFNVQEMLRLSKEEAFFLSYALGCLVVHNEKNEVEDLCALWQRFCSADSRFLAKYAAYHNFRSKGWVPGSGLKYGSDFVLYNSKGPPFYHSTYSVVVQHVTGRGLAPKDCGIHRSHTWTSLAAFNRMTEHVAKDVLFCYVIEPSDLTEEEKRTPKCLSRLKIQEVVLRRWVSKQERENAEYVLIP